MKERGKVGKLEELVKTQRGTCGAYWSRHINCPRNTFLYVPCRGKYVISCPKKTSIQTFLGLEKVHLHFNQLITANAVNDALEGNSQ